ncbi:unnamed protein product [Thelazia callipaeda]|uniref:Glycosyltransferase n=1 Tax=Thelazia callipaeda TaxID=103827 RepID=A0A0N5D6Q3_THECL|nr:unnamed protein product [Thelazia callipaeda]
MHKVIVMLSRPMAASLRHISSNIFSQLIFGISIGALLGCFTLIDYETELSHFTQRLKTHQSDYAHNTNRNVSIFTDAYVKCVIYIHHTQSHKHKYILSLRDTYTKYCNDTIYVTNSENVRKDFSEELELAFVQTSKTLYHWELYREILKYCVRKKQEQPFWIVVGSEQTFVVMKNLRAMLAAHTPSKCIAFGRIYKIRNLLSYVFPLSSYTRILPQTGIVFSSKALERLVDTSCTGLLFHRSTSRALIRCSDLMNVELIDPVDKEKQHLFVPEGLKALIPNASTFSSKISKGSACCSDHTVSFGGVKYSEHRLLQFALSQIKMATL